MAADDRLFRFQRAALPSVVTPAWIEPCSSESLSAYALRLARCINPVAPCFVGGASFGGMVALEMAVHLRAEACFLIASVRSDRELPWRFRTIRPLARLGPEGLGRASACVAHWLAPSLPEATVGRLRQLSRPQAAFLRWASWAALNWRPNPEIRDVRVYQIHGAADRTIPVRCTRPDVVVPGAGHLLTLTHSESVNEFIRSRVETHCHA
jgi:pimeloyl-ACP methyl ester carboxylesterase